jgi:pimeloyl-ACP methyl ester carboxylesterase
MHRTLSRYAALLCAIALAAVILPAAAQSAPPKIGIVVMHGKGGSPTKFVADLARSLEGKECLVANIEMAWSGRRDYDVPVAAAEQEVEAALDGLRARGATKLFVAGHSQGGLFALYFGGRHRVDGIVAIAPGGSSGSPIAREKLGESVERARALIAEGKPDEKTRFLDYEGTRGAYPIIVAPANYLNWFDPDGAMNEAVAVKKMNPDVPVLFIVPTNDYPGLQKIKQAAFDALPKHPLTRLYEPNSSHLNAPSASFDEIVRWTAEVAERRAQ